MDKLLDSAMPPSYRSRPSTTLILRKAVVLVCRLMRGCVLLEFHGGAWREALAHRTVNLTRINMRATSGSKLDDW
jgi:hypothetical protein